MIPSGWLSEDFGNYWVRPCEEASGGNGLRMLGMVGALENLADSVKGRLRRRYGINRLQIASYPGFSNEEHLFIRGRVLVGKVIESGDLKHGKLRNFNNMAKRFLSAEIPHARLLVEWQGHRKEVEADHEGYFFERLPIDPTRELGLKISSNEEGMDHVVEVEPQIFAMSPTARLIIVSDMDDTVLLTMATKALRMVAITLFGNSHTRRHFEGVPGFYQRLQKGKSEDGNPLFYVSSSPWNLYDFLEEFLTVNQIPLGPMFLRDHGLENRRLTLRDHRSHKIQAIEKLLDVFPDLPFLLVGDTGQKDPEIYLEVVQRHSTRIKGVLLRNVTQLLPRRVAEVEQRGREMEDFGCHFCLFEGTEEAEGAVQEWGLMPSSEDAGCEVGDV